ncbi:MAG: Mur ligase domain-containing protein, partial [Patescibacteria group bacterium]
MYHFKIMPKNNDILRKAKKVHFIGIGGIGVSAIARMMLQEGKKVSGSDTSPSAITDELKKLRAKIFLGHKAKHVRNNADLVIYTPA